MTPTSDAAAAVEWQIAERPPAPVAVRVPYVELKLEHPELDATHVEEEFFPDAIPYAADDETRVFYWRAALPSDVPPVAAWTGVAATTHGLRALTRDEASVPPLVADRTTARELVVDGTVGGDSTTVPVEGYVAPDVAVRNVTPERVRMDAAGVPVTVRAGDRATHEPPEQTVRLKTVGVSESKRVTVTPHLRIRYPGERTLYHPAPGAAYALFPSFGLRLDDLPNPVSVPTAHGELDQAALADALGVALDARPYSERLLWQAFAYTAFDPHRDTAARLAETDGDLLVVANPDDS